MAGDWIKIEVVTPGKPEIDILAELLSVTVNEVIGGLVRLWIWADQQTVDGNAHSVTKCAIDRHSGVTGLANAMLCDRVEWLVESGKGGFVFPNFDRHNGQTAKCRVLTAKRVAESKKRKGNAPSVTSALPREEKRREEYVGTNVPTKVRRFCIPSVGEVEEYARSIGWPLDGQSWCDSYAAKGWKLKGGAPMKDWRAAVRTWKHNEWRTGPNHKPAQLTIDQLLDRAMPKEKPSGNT